MDSSIVAVISLLVFTGAVILSALLVAWKNGWSFIQPHALHAAWLVMLLGLIPLLQRAYGVMDSPEGVAKTAGVLLMHLVFFTLPFLWAPKILKRLAAGRSSRLNPPLFSSRQHAVLVAVGLLTMAGAYVAVAEVDGFGLLNWLRFPRIGYQYFHKGTGFWYVLTMAALMFLFLWVSFYVMPRRRGWIVLLWILCAGLSYFTGNKTITVALGIQAVVASHFLVSRIKPAELAVWGVLITVVFMGFFSAYDLSFNSFLRQQESETLRSQDGGESAIPPASRYGGSMPGGSLVEKIINYSTHYDDTRIFIGEFDRRFQRQYGREYLDGLWKYVPRLLVHWKPLSYGRLRYIYEVMYPGCVGSGHMPDIGGPPFRSSIDAYLNFGLAGVCLLALLKGTVSFFFLERMKSCPDFFGYTGLSVCMGYPFLPSVDGFLGPSAWYLILLSGLWIFYWISRQRVSQGRGPEQSI